MAMAPVCNAQMAVGATPEPRGTEDFRELPGVDPDVVPGDDFFGYANGDWLRRTSIPPGKDRVSARTQINETVQAQVQQLMADASKGPQGSLARKVGDFAAAYALAPVQGGAAVRPIAGLLRQINAVQTKAALAALLGRQLRADVDPLNLGIYNSAQVLGLSVESGLHGEKDKLAFLLQGGLGLPQRDDYLNAGQEHQALRARYVERLAQALALTGAGPARSLPARAQAVLALETALAQSHATPEQSAQDSNADNLWTRSDLDHKAPGMDWRAFFTAAGLSQQDSFIVWQPSAITGVAALVADGALPVWKDYLRFHAVHQYPDQLKPAEIAPEQRVQRAVAATQRQWGEAVGRLYVERYFAPAYKARVQAIAGQVISAFEKRLTPLAWMSEATKVQARRKLNAVYFGLGYPDQWSDYSSLRISATDPIGNQQRVAQLAYQQALARLGQPVDPRAWALSAHTVGALLLFQTNAYNFPAGLLLAPKFDPTATDAENFGAIGAIVGHEVSHFIDTLGMEYNAAGALQRWWSPQDEARYAAATQPLVAQYASYQPLAERSVNGQATLVENLADLGGLAAAWDAYRASSAAQGLSPAALRTHDQQFFIGFARSWRSKLSDEALRKQVASDHHAPDATRIATVRNLDAWYEAFDVLPGQRLYLPPQERVKVW